MVLVEKELAALKRPGDSCRRPSRGSLGCRGPGTSGPGFGSGLKGTAAARPHGQSEDHGLLGVLAGWGAGSGKGVGCHPPAWPSRRQGLCSGEGGARAAGHFCSGCPSTRGSPICQCEAFAAEAAAPRAPRPGGAVCPPRAGVQEADVARLRPSLLCLPGVWSPRVQGSAWCQVGKEARGATRWMGQWSELGLPSDRLLGTFRWLLSHGVSMTILQASGNKRPAPRPLLVKWVYRWVTCARAEPLL